MSWGGTLNMPRGSGWGDYKKGERVLKIKDLKEGAKYLSYSKQFDAKNVIYIEPEGKSELKPLGSSMFTNNQVFMYVKPNEKLKKRNDSDAPMQIGEAQLQDNYANYNFFKIKDRKY